MQVLSGKGLCDGIAVGKIFFINRCSGNVDKKAIYDTSEEAKRLNFAVEKANLQIEKLKDKTEKSADKNSSMKFENIKSLLSDNNFIGEIEKYIASNRVCAEYAVSQISKQYMNKYKNMDEPSMQEKSEVVSEVSELLINILTGSEYSSATNGNVIVAVDHLTLSETAKLDKTHVLGFIMKKDGISTNTTIMAKMMNVPTVTNLGDSVNDSINGKTAYIDGSEGKLYIQPDNSTIEMLEQRRKLQNAKNDYLNELKGKENITKCGHRIKLYAKISTSTDINNVLINDAEGIGLFKSEFMYMGRKTLPTEEELFEIYKATAQKMGSKPVVIRTLDIGSDKQIEAIDIPKEKNPAIGLRSIRICLEKPEIFQTQIRAICRASAFGNLSILLPMVTNIEEVIRAKALILETCTDLKSENINFKEIPIGVIIETPASALISDQLAKHVDFFSVEINDLSQYTLAVDRQNPHLAELYTAHHPATLKLVKLAADNIHKEGKSICVCGKSISDEELFRILLSIGIDEFSVPAEDLLPVKNLILNSDLSTYKLPQEYKL